MGLFHQNQRQVCIRGAGKASAPPLKPPALRAVVTARTPKSVRAFSYSSSSQAPYPSFPPKRAKTHSFRCSASPQQNRFAGFRRGPVLSTGESSTAGGIRLGSSRWGRDSSLPPKRAHSPSQAVTGGEFPFRIELLSAAGRSGSTPPGRTPNAGASFRRIEVPGIR